MKIEKGVGAVTELEVTKDGRLFIDGVEYTPKLKPKYSAFIVCSASSEIVVCRFPVRDTMIVSLVWNTRLREAYSEDASCLGNHRVVECSDLYSAAVAAHIEQEGVNW